MLRPGAEPAQWLWDKSQLWLTEQYSNPPRAGGGGGGGGSLTLEAQTPLTASHTSGQLPVRASQSSALPTHYIMESALIVCRMCRLKTKSEVAL